MKSLPNILRIMVTVIHLKDHLGEGIHLRQISTTVQAQAQAQVQATCLQDPEAMASVHRVVQDLVLWEVLQEVLWADQWVVQLVGL